MSAEPLLPSVDGVDGAHPITVVRVLFADTDAMGIGYHASYLRYLELARVSFLRQVGCPYVVLQEHGVGLPLTDLAVRYRAPARYDDQLSIYIGVSLLTQVRMHFQYRCVVEAGGRVGLDHAVEVLTAETRHACVRYVDTRPSRLPSEVFARLEAVAQARVR